MGMMSFGNDFIRDENGNIIGEEDWGSFYEAMSQVDWEAEGKKEEDEATIILNKAVAMWPEVYHAILLTKKDRQHGWKQAIKLKVHWLMYWYGWEEGKSLNASINIALTESGNYKPYIELICPIRKIWGPSIDKKEMEIVERLCMQPNSIKPPKS